MFVYLAFCQEFSHPVGGSCVPGCSGVAGDNITIQCNDGHILQGSPSVMCQKNGTWSTSIPTCVGELLCIYKYHNILCLFITLATCPTITAPTNGQCQSCNGIAGQLILFTCDDQYTLIGSHNITCLSNGHWSAPTPTCTGL